MKSRINNLLSVIAVLMAMTMLSACGPNETEEALDGKWESTSYLINQNGVKMDAIFTFDAENMMGSIAYRFFAFEMGNVMDMKMKFRWSADANRISMDFYGDPEIKFHPIIDMAAAIMGENANQAKKYFKNQLASKILADLKDGLEEEIVSLTGQYLTINDSNVEEITFKRVGRSRYAGKSKKKSSNDEVETVVAVPEDEVVDWVEEAVAEPVSEVVPEFDFFWTKGPFSVDGVIYREAPNSRLYRALGSEEDGVDFGIFYRMIPNDGSPDMVIIKDQYSASRLKYAGRNDRGMLVYKDEMRYDSEADATYQQVLMVKEDGNGGLNSEGVYYTIGEGSDAPDVEFHLVLTPVN